MARAATCCCGQLRVECEGEPAGVSICHCLECQRRTGSIFGTQARFARAQVVVTGRETVFTRTGESGGHIDFHFCPDCGTTLYWEPDGMPDWVVVAVGAFANPGFQPPSVSVYEDRHHSWFDVGALDVKHHE